jgi:ribosomal protein S18 acetylase RimI-like enzyme
MQHKERALFIPHTVRAATPSDMDAMLALLAELYQEEGSPYVQDSAMLHQALFGAVCSMRLRGLVAENEGVVLGLVFYYSGYDVSSSTFGFHLTDIIVQKQVRRSGIGRTLFAQMTAQCISENGVWLSLTVLPRNTAARAFYQSLGFSKEKVDFHTMGLSKMMVHAPALVGHAVGITN